MLKVLGKKSKFLVEKVSKFLRIASLYILIALEFGPMKVYNNKIKSMKRPTRMLIFLYGVDRHLN